jgi:phosphatidylserine decarboxylase
MALTKHQFIDRETSAVQTERLYGDRFLNWAYRAPWDDARWLCRILSCRRTSQALGFFNYDLPFSSRLGGVHRFVRSMGVDLSECVEPPEALNTPRKLFERRLRYWEVRPMDRDPRAIVSPCDARMLVGSLAESSTLFLKGKFFDSDELFGCDRPGWQRAFQGGQYAIFRLTPDKYHYNHAPVSGVVRDYYHVSGRYHSCNPGAVVTVPTPYSKNERIVTVLDTDVPNGTQIGLVAMIEVVALMIGRIVQCYSGQRYDAPQDITSGMFLEKGQPKSLYRPGSSTTVLVFQLGRMRFCNDLVRNRTRPDVESRFSQWLGRTLVETDVKARSTIGRCWQQQGEES